MNEKMFLVQYADYSQQTRVIKCKKGLRKILFNQNIFYESNVL